VVERGWVEQNHEHQGCFSAAGERAQKFTANKIFVLNPAVYFKLRRKLLNN